jgi:SAM-dependent methyltransferase
MQPDQAVIEGWTGSAPFWGKHRDMIREFFAPVTEALIDDAAIANGQTVLDIATGAGEPALCLAAVVGATGKVIGVDPIPEMVAAARLAASQLGSTNAHFEVAFADQLPFPADTFDAVISRFGVMFCPSPVGAVRETLRVLKPQRRLAFAVWHFVDQNPFFHAVQRVVDQFVVPAPRAPDALDAFRFARPGKLRDVLAEAGVISPSERRLEFAIEAPLSAEDFCTLRYEISDSLRGKLALLSKDQAAEVRRQSIESLRQYSTPSGMSIPAQVLILSGTKS